MLEEASFGLDAESLVPKRSLEPEHSAGSGPGSVLELAAEVLRRLPVEFQGSRRDLSLGIPSEDRMGLDLATRSVSRDAEGEVDAHIARVSAQQRHSVLDALAGW